MARASTLVFCLIALAVAAGASARTDSTGPVQIGLGPYYGGPIGARDWVAEGRTTGVTVTVQNVTNHPIRNVHVRVLLPGMKVLKRYDFRTLARVRIHIVRGGATFTVPVADPVKAPTVGLTVRLTAKPDVLQCPTIFAAYAGKSAKWADRGWCWTQAP